MNKRIILITIPILLVALLLVAAIPAAEDVKPMVTYTAKEQMCKVIKEGTVKEQRRLAQGMGRGQVCQNTSSRSPGHRSGYPESDRGLVQHRKERCRLDRV